MEIKFNTRRSRFLLPLQAAIRSNHSILEKGGSVYASLPGRGFPGLIQITINQPNKSSFFTNWANSDPTWFPARIKAAATALKSFGYVGCFEISHIEGRVKIRQI